MLLHRKQLVLLLDICGIMIVLLNQGGGEGALFFTGKVLRFRSAGIALSQLCRMPPYRTHSLRKADGIWDAG